MLMDNTEFQQRAAQIEQLIECVSSLSDEAARTASLDMVQALMDLHGAGLTRILELLSESGEQGRSALSKLGSDPLVCGLLVLYGIHPIPLEERVRNAVEKVLPQIRKQSGSADLLGISDGIVRLSILASGNGCHSSPDALLRTLEQSIREAAPEVVEVVSEGGRSMLSGFVPLNTLQAGAAPESIEGNNYEESAA